MMRDSHQKDNSCAPLCGSTDHKRDADQTPLSESVANERRRELSKLIPLVKACDFNKAVDFKVHKCFICDVKLSPHMPFFWLTHLLGAKHNERLYKSGYFYTHEGLQYYETVLNKLKGSQPLSFASYCCSVCEFVKGSRHQGNWNSFREEPSSPVATDEFTGLDSSTQDAGINASREWKRTRRDESRAQEDRFNNDKRCADQRQRYREEAENGRPSTSATKEPYISRDSRKCDSDERKELLQKLKECESTSADLRMEIDRSHAEIQTQKNDISRLNDTIEEKNTVIADLKHQSTNLDATCEKCLQLKKACDESDIKSSKYRQLAIKYKAMHEELLQTSPISNMSSNVDAETNTEDLGQDDDKKVIKLRMQTNQLKTEKSQLVLANEKLQEANSHCEKEVNILKIELAKVQALCEESRSLTSQLEDMEHQLNVEKARPLMESMLASVHNDEWTACEEHVNLLNNEIQTLTKDLAKGKEQSENEIRILREEVASLKKDVFAVNFQNVHLKQEKNKYAVEIQRLKQEHKDTVDQLTTELRISNETRDQFKKKNENYDAMVPHLKKMADSFSNISQS